MRLVERRRPIVDLGLERPQQLELGQRPAGKRCCKDDATKNLDRSTNNPPPFNWGVGAERPTCTHAAAGTTVPVGSPGQKEQPATAGCGAKRPAEFRPEPADARRLALQSMSSGISRIARRSMSNFALTMEHGHATLPQGTIQAVTCRQCPARACRATSSTASVAADCRAWPGQSTARPNQIGPRPPNRFQLGASPSPERRDKTRSCDGRMMGEKPLLLMSPPSLFLPGAQSRSSRAGVDTMCACWSTMMPCEHKEPL